jgi:membrane protein YdbS with pleckstrin-like domain
MAFPRKLLADHEKIVLDLRPHWIEVLPSALWSVALLAVLFLGYAAVDAVMETNPEPAKAVVGGAVLIAWIFLALIPFLKWRFTMFVLTTDRLITRHGIIAKNSKEIPLERINDVAFSQSIAERLVGAGDLLVESAGERGQTRIENIRKPEQVQLMIYKEIEKNNPSFAVATPKPTFMQPPDPLNPLAQLEALARLRDQGAITSAEFETKKQELLRRL